MKRGGAAAICGLLLTLALAAVAFGQDASPWDELVALSESRPEVKTLSADFRQEKFTPLLRDPIVSRGRVVMLSQTADTDAGSRWETLEPYASTMVIAAGELKLYYPQQQSLEIYDLGDRLDAMATSPVPDLAVLRDNFSLESSTWNDDRSVLSLSLLPKSEAMQQALQEVKVEVDAAQGVLRRLSLTDLDDETTVMVFENIQLNPPLDPAALELDVPTGTKIVRPLESVGQ